MKIKDLIELSDEIITNSKIHFAIGPKDRFEPLYAFYRDEFKAWQENQSNNNFKKDYILSLIYFGKDEWLFAGIYKQNSIIQVEGRFIYETTLQDYGRDLIGKLVIYFKKPFRQSFPFLIKCIDKFELVEILRAKYTFAPFPGFERVKIKYELLKSIIDQEEKSWKTALSNVKGIYLISNLINGSLYVGSAYGENAFWNRWKEYAVNGHGSNANLKKLIHENGLEYANNFQFSILETRSMNSEDDEIINRESFWKDILLSREFGYNKN